MAFFGLSQALAIAQQNLTPVVRPGKNPISFGPITFSTEECPDFFPIGANESMVATHDIPGGGRVVNSYGNRPKDVSWTGKFYGVNIEPRVQQLRALQVNASEELFSWWFEQYYGIITSFDPGYRGGYNEYQITIEITRDANGAFTIASQLSIDQQVTTLQNQMTQLNVSIAALDAAGAASFQQSLSDVNASIAAAAPLSTNLIASSNSIITSLGNAIDAVDDYTGTISQNAPQYVASVQLSSTLASIQSLIVGSEAPNATTVQGGSLFGLAAAQYGDPSQAFALAAANGLRLPFVTGAKSTSISLPQL